MRHVTSLVLLSAATFLFTGCGAGKAIGNAIGNGIVNTLTGWPVHSVEGYLTDTGTVVQGDVLIVGDDGGPEALRATFGFDMPVSTFSQAFLRLHVDQIVGLPFAKLGGMWLEVVDLGGSLDPSDFFSPNSSSMEIMSVPTWGQIDIDVTAMAQAAQLAGHGEIHFRLRMVGGDSGDIVSDYVVLSSHDAGIDTSRPNIFFNFD